VWVSQPLLTSHLTRHSVLGIVHRYEALKRMSPAERAKAVPRVCILGGKAAPGYEMAKRIIKLVWGACGCDGVPPVAVMGCRLA
jgi:hypothetical protein